MGRMSERFDVAVVGGGIVGLATALRCSAAARICGSPCSRRSTSSAPTRPATTAASSTPGSTTGPARRRRGCALRAGRLERLLPAHEVPHEICGKLVVATSEMELPRLDELARARGRERRRGPAGGGPREFRKIEPHAAGLGLASPPTGITDFGGSRPPPRVRSGRAAASPLRPRGDARPRRGGRARSGHERGHVAARTSSPARASRPTASRIDGDAPRERIVPFRGDYYTLRPGARPCQGTPLSGARPAFSVPRRPLHARSTAASRRARTPSWRSRARATGGRPSTSSTCRRGRVPGLLEARRGNLRHGGAEFYRARQARVRGALQKLMPDIRSDDVGSAAPACGAGAAARRHARRRLLLGAWPTSTS